MEKLFQSVRNYFKPDIDRTHPAKRCAVKLINYSVIDPRVDRLDGGARLPP